MQLKRSTFVQNALILTGTSLLLRTAGMFFRVYLSNKIGAEGMGLYQLIISIYVLGSAFASAGISTAVTRLVTDELVCGTKKSVIRILRRAVQVSFLIGLASSALLYFTADIISTYWLQDVRAAASIRILAAGLPFMGISSCLRGYFTARRKAANPARAQLLEQAVRIGLILLLIDRFLPRGIEVACMVVLFADITSETVACGYLALMYFLDKRKLPKTINGGDTKPRVLARLMEIAVPITASRYLRTALHTIENTLVPSSLAKYTGAKDVGLSQFGMLKGMVIPLLFFPSSFLTALSTLLVPEISEAAALGQKRRLDLAVNRTLHLTLAASILVSGYFTVYARPLGVLLYGSPEVGFLLQVLAPLMPLMYLESLVDGILKGLNQQVTSLKYSVIDSVVRIVLIVTMVPFTGIKGFLFVMLVSNTMTSLLNLHHLLDITNLKIQWYRWVGGPLLAVAIGGGASYLITRLPVFASLPQVILLVMGLLVVSGLYVLVLWMLGCLPEIRLGARKILPAV